MFTFKDVSAAENNPPVEEITLAGTSAALNMTDSGTAAAAAPAAAGHNHQQLKNQLQRCPDSLQQMDKFYYKQPVEERQFPGCLIHIEENTEINIDSLNYEEGGGIEFDTFCTRELGTNVRICKRLGFASEKDTESSGFIDWDVDNADVVGSCQVIQDIFPDMLEKSVPEEDQENLEMRELNFQVSSSLKESGTSQITSFTEKIL